jgi:uncharacterized protein YkwD
MCTTTMMVLAVVTWTASSASAQTATCPVTAQDQAVDAEEQALLGLINQYRQASGRNALAMHSGVTRAAAWFSRDMATKNYFPYNHVDSNGRSVDQRLTWCGVSFSNWAENIYAGSPGAQAVFDAWKASSSHNTNMLRDGVTAAGIARAYSAGSTYGWYWTLDVTNSASVTTTTTTRPVTTTTPTTTPPTATTTTTPTTTGPAPGSPEWYAQWYPQYFGTTTTTRPVATTTTTRPVSTTTTTRPVTTTTSTTARPPTTTTTAPTTGPAPGTAEWYRWYYSQYYGT